MYIKKKEDTIIQKVFQMLAYIINTQYSKSVMLILFLKMQLSCFGHNLNLVITAATKMIN